MKLTTKENFLLQDLKKHEELCIKKYDSYSNQAQDQQLKQLFKSHEKQEQEHLNTINQILSGNVPNMNQNQQQNTQGSQGQNVQSQGSAANSMFNQNDADLCQDILSTEKYVSSAYNTAIFEFADHNTRQALNHIQKEEQEHGEDVFNYMQSHGMYQVQ